MLGVLLPGDLHEDQEGGSSSCAAGTVPVLLLRQVGLALNRFPIALSQLGRLMAVPMEG